ncbi:MAG TPA: FemAB family XrtA/PEP-CTERM system-associated protein [Vicinamibacterales bacterium]|nr:FemAB family XrtA/PEP-CTERM system-associated protein [Vicinamibacterales bacterium]
MSVAVLVRAAAISSSPIVTADVGEAEWNGFVARHPDATAYHLWKWREIFERVFGHETVYLAAIEHGSVVGVLPLVIFESRIFGRFAVSLPFVNYGGVLAQDGASADALLQRATEIAADRKLAHVELRHVARQFPDLQARTHKVGMLLKLERDGAQAWERLDRKVRNQVRKAEKSQMTARVGGVELLDNFYGVFARNMRDLGTPVYSRRFFAAVLAAFPETARVFLVDTGDVTVAGAITLSFGDTVENPWASSLREYRSLSPNTLLYWRMIEHAVAAGHTTFDFGRSTPNEGTYNFKAQWGAQPVPLHWEYALQGGRELPNLSPSNPKFRTAIAVWTRLPLAVTTRLGPHIVRSIP